jgi:hypothetical protein
MSEKFQSVFRKEWREVNDTWLDDRCDGVGCRDRWARTLCALATHLLTWQHCCWCLFWTFKATISSYQVAFPFVNPYLNQDFCGILQHEAMCSHIILELGLFQNLVGVQC